MTDVLKLWPLLTATHRYDKSISTRNRGQGTQIEAPILAFLIETCQGRILFDVGCDYAKLSDPALKARWFDPVEFPMGPPEMTEDQRLPAHLARHGLTPADIDLVFLSHLHFDHAGGLCEFCGCDVHVHEAELEAARTQADDAYFADDFTGDYRWKVQREEYALVPGVQAINTPGHTAGHMSLLIELPQGRPVILTGDAADLQENLTDEIAPGLCWQDREDLALDSIRKLKGLAAETEALLWPNHDMAFWRTLKRFPEYHA
ncbi:N-acyl homoserine lactonase family protein [Pseudomonas stutzeri]|uniref:N-acyl homoserine lactonase family protein n=1 Tax=Stutzerimonas stutzeri TaxID=316 RepID=UPI00210AEADC|nr:N-acyl homoserine lactonase family protein [Stutzerimonas stutzeri]MCQ4310483.1 N-acyl homoserine lactonase family protein [Stutzerimonas stutzeri]